jgi:H+/Cl- antiporter ClcA
MSIFTLIGGVLFNVAIFGGLLFVPVGTLDWWRAWAFLGVVFCGTVVSTVSVFRVNKAILAERFKPPVQQGQPLADKIVVLLLIAGFVSVMVCCPWTCSDGISWPHPAHSCRLWGSSFLSWVGGS